MPANILWNEKSYGGNYTDNLLEFKIKDPVNPYSHIRSTHHWDIVTASYGLFSLLDRFYPEDDNCYGSNNSNKNSNNLKNNNHN